MHAPSPSMRGLARLLVSKTASDPHVHGAGVVIEKLRISLTRFAGAEGFASLLRRALTLASADVPSLQSVKVGADGRVEGIEHLAAETGTGAGGEVEAALAGHLLELLVTFIGEPLTLRLVRGAWSDTSLDEYNSRSEAD
jgi:hypothetical protein